MLLGGQGKTHISGTVGLGDVKGIDGSRMGRSHIRHLARDCGSRELLKDLRTSWKKVHCWASKMFFYLNLGELLVGIKVAGWTPAWGGGRTVPCGVSNSLWSSGVGPGTGEGDAEWGGRGMGVGSSTQSAEQVQWWPARLAGLP